MHDLFFCRLPDDYRCGKSLGPVESLQEHPQQPEKILIGYSRGLVVLWDLGTRHVDQLFLGKQVLRLQTVKVRTYLMLISWSVNMVWVITLEF